MQNVKINGKWDILLPEHRAARPEWHTEKGWERERLDSMREHLTDKDVMVYVGAEEGDMAGLIASWGVRMMLFEPNDRVWSNIKAIWQHNKLPEPLVAFPGFASDTNSNWEGNVFSFCFPPCADGPLISDHGFKELIDPGSIPQVTLDRLPFDFTAMSIDVEGSEWLVLRGAEEKIRKNMPKIWISVHPEFMFRMYGQYQAELRKWIRDLGYKEQLLAYDHEVHLYYEPENRPILGVSQPRPEVEGAKNG